MPVVLLFHLLVGLVTGTLFGVQTLLLLALLVLVEGVGWMVADRVASGAGWWVCAEIVLQSGYLVGVYLRAQLERFRPALQVASHRRTQGRIL